MDLVWYRGTNSESPVPRGNVVWLTKSKQYAQSYGTNVYRFDISSSAKILDMRRETRGFGTWVEHTVAEWAKKLARKRVQLNSEGVRDLADEETSFEGLFESSSESVPNASDLDTEGSVKRAGYDAVRYFEPQSGGPKREVLMVLNGLHLKGGA